MKPKPTLRQKISAFEYVYGYGFKSYDAAYSYATERPEEISACESPRVVSYSTVNGERYAIVLTDTDLSTY